MLSQNTELEARINRVIHIPEFEEVLNRYGSGIIEFQCMWSKAKSFDDLPEAFQCAIIAGENILNHTGIVELVEKYENVPHN